MNISSENMIKQLLETENHQLKALNQIVADSLKEQKLLTHRLRSKKREKATFSARVADHVARFGGSWTFIIIFTCLIGLWILFNSTFNAEHFDPYPYILLNLILSTVAALQAPVIMMSQNRQEIKDRERSEHDYLINLKAELEVRTLHQKIDHLILEQLKILIDSQQRQLEILDSLDKNILRTIS